MKRRHGLDFREKLAAIFFIAAVMLIPEINQGMEGALKKSNTQIPPLIEDISILEGLYVHWIPADIRTRILLEANHDLQDMENLILAALPDQSAEILIPKGKDKKYKLWAFPLDEKLKEKIPNLSLFDKVQQDFRKWAWKKRESVERQLGMPIVGSEEEKPYLFKKGWFDASEDPENPIPYEIDHDFYLSDFVTQEVWVEVMGENPAYDFLKKAPCPEKDAKVITKIRLGKDGTQEVKEIKYCEGWAVTNINLYDARKFVHIMNMGSPAHVKYDIPTEWQFDLAARGGIISKTKEKITNTGRFGSLAVTDLETFKTKIPWTGDYIKGPGRTKQKSPFPHPFGPHDLIGHLKTWTKSPWVEGGLEARRIPSFTTEVKNWGLDWNLKKRGGSTSPRVIRGPDWCDREINLGVDDNEHCPSWCRSEHLGLRLLRISHKTLKTESSVAVAEM